MNLSYEKSYIAKDASIHSIKAYLWGIICGSSFSAILLVLSSLAFVKIKNIPQAFIEPLVIFICALGAFIGGYVTVRISKERGMLKGMVTGFLLFVLTFIASLVFTREPLTMISVIKCLSMVLTGAIAGIIGVNKKSSRK